MITRLCYTNTVIKFTGRTKLTKQSLPATLQSHLLKYTFPHLPPKEKEGCPKPVLGVRSPIPLMQVVTQPTASYLSQMAWVSPCCPHYCHGQTPSYSASSGPSSLPCLVRAFGQIKLYSQHMFTFVHT